MATAWRIVKTKYRAEAFNGEGARLYGGRWTSEGRRAIYVSSSLSLATLEMLVHLDAVAVLASYSLFCVEIPDALIEALDPGRLPPDWRNYPAPAILQQLGDHWLESRASVAWKVPSAVNPLEYNYVLNPEHRQFSAIRIGSPQTYPLDSRLIRPRRRSRPSRMV